MRELTPPEIELVRTGPMRMAPWNHLHLQSKAYVEAIRGFEYDHGEIKRYAQSLLFDEQNPWRSIYSLKTELSAEDIYLHCYYDSADLRLDLVIVYDLNAGYLVGHYFIQKPLPHVHVKRRVEDGQRVVVRMIFKADVWVLDGAGYEGFLNWEEVPFRAAVYSDGVYSVMPERSGEWNIVVHRKGEKLDGCFSAPVEVRVETIQESN